MVPEPCRKTDKTELRIIGSDTTNIVNHDGLICEHIVKFCGHLEAL
jgi:hypothetical protein